MAFKLKDLMVDVLPGTGTAAGQNPPAQCPQPSVPHCPLPSVVQHCPLPSIVHCAVSVAAAGCFAPSVQQPLCPFPSVQPCQFPSVNQMVAAQCPFPSVPTQCQSPSVNQMVAAQCPFPSVNNPGTGAPDASQLSDLATLRQQLQQALAQVDQHEQALHAAAKPQTVEEAATLEQQMKDALAELQAHKADLEKKQQT